MAIVIDGRCAADAILKRVTGDVRSFVERQGRAPGLAVILVGHDPASDIYVRRKVRACERSGIRSFQHRLAEDTPEASLFALIEALNADADVHGVLVQLPLPDHLDASAILDRISPAKDVDGFHPVNVGRLSSSGQGLVPCTPLGCMRLLDSVIERFEGLHAVIIGKSNVVGKPVALLLLERECTVTVTHIMTRDLPALVRTADIVVVAAGSPRLVRGDWIKPGAVVIDVGITRITEDGIVRIVGDAVHEEMDHALAVTPVPGGVGPMTIACLIENTMQAALLGEGGQ